MTADAFTPAAVSELLAAKDRGRSQSVPVLVEETFALSGLSASVPRWRAGWPGVPAWLRE